MANPLKQFENDPVKQKQFEEAVLSVMARSGKSTSELGPLDDLSRGAIAAILAVDSAGLGMIADFDTFNGRRYLWLSKQNEAGEFVSPHPSPELAKQVGRRKREIVDWICGHRATSPGGGGKR